MNPNIALASVSEFGSKKCYQLCSMRLGHYSSSILSIQNKKNNLQLDIANPSQSLAKRIGDTL